MIAASSPGVAEVGGVALHHEVLLGDDAGGVDQTGVVGRAEDVEAVGDDPAPGEGVEVLVVPLAGVGALDVLVGREVGRREVRVEAGEADDGPDGEEADDHDDDAERALPDGVDERLVVAWNK